MILATDRDPRSITIRRGRTLSDADHRLLALWAAACAEHGLHCFESVQRADLRPRQAIAQTRAWMRGAITMSEARAAAGAAMAAARAGTVSASPATAAGLPSAPSSRATTASSTRSVIRGASPSNISPGFPP